MSSNWQDKRASKGELTPVNEYNPTKPNAVPDGVSPSDAGRPLRRFWFRSAVGLISPLIITAYFLAVWRVYVAPVDRSSPFAVGPPGTTYVFYSWFLAGIVGLNLSLYGLAGVQASLLMDPAWAAADGMALVALADTTWSGPGGWAKTARQLVRRRRGGTTGDPKLPSRLWVVLAVPSMLAFAAWPLSGLSFEISPGYIRSMYAAGSSPDVAGFTYANFNERNVGDALYGAEDSWQYAVDPRVPGMGIVYTPPGQERIPGSSLPTRDGVSRAFLTAQAGSPIEGNSWGLALQYNCSIVDKLSDFTLLKYNKTANFTSSRTRLQGQNQDIIVNRGNTSYTFNMYGVVEFAYTQWPNASARTQQTREDPNSIYTKTSSCYFNQAENITGDYPGLEDDPTVFEMVLWQLVMPAGYVSPRPNYNLTVDANLTELFGAYDYNEFSNVRTNLSNPMTAIGARCTSASNVGTAFVDGVRSTFSDFTRTDTPINAQRNRCAMRFGAPSIGFLFSTLVGAFGSDVTGANPAGWLGNFFTSIAAPPPFYAAYSDDPVDQGTGALLQLAYLQAADLRRSLLRVHAAYAAQLMYNGGQGFTALDGSRTVGVNPNVTEFPAGQVLTPGIVPPVVPAVMFVAWAVIVVGLCAAYGFRRRWADTLDGYSLFRFGADLPADARERLAEYSNTGGAEECLALNSLPGLVGDRRPDSWRGHIALVDSARAIRSKRYD